MPKFTFIGEPGGTVAFGLSFPPETPVEVTDESFIRKLRGHPHFAETFDGVQVIGEDPPKRRGRPPKAK